MNDKTTDITGATEAAAPTPRAHNAGGGGAAAGGSKRFSAKRKLAIVQRLLRGESLETVSRDENVAVHRLTGFSVGSMEEVQRVHQLGLDLGGRCEGAPGQRGPRFSSYLRDLDGNKLCISD